MAATAAKVCGAAGVHRHMVRPVSTATLTPTTRGTGDGGGSGAGGCCDSPWPVLAARASKRSSWPSIMEAAWREEWVRRVSFDTWASRQGLGHTVHTAGAAAGSPGQRGVPMARQAPPCSRKRGSPPVGRLVVIAECCCKAAAAYEQWLERAAGSSMGPLLNERLRDGAQLDCTYAHVEMSAG